jgi:hypothetical protein
VVVALVAVLVLSTGGDMVNGVKSWWGSRSEFLRLIGAEVWRQLSELRPDLTDDQRRRVGAIVAAQAAHESGYGKSAAWLAGWNFGNLTAGSSWDGATVGGGDRDADGNPITQTFRAYPSLAAAVSDFFDLLSWTRYRAARDALMAGDVNGYASALHAAGYYTASITSYRAGIAAALPAATEAIA